MAIALDTPTRSLQIVLSGAKNTLDAQFLATYSDVPVGGAHMVAMRDVPFSNPGTTNGVTSAVVVPAPPGNTAYRRVLKSLSLSNVDTAAITLSINFVDTAGVTTALFRCTLQTLETLVYEDGFGFDALDANGAVKSQNSATSSATSTADSKAVQASSMASIGLLGSSQASSMASLSPASVSSQASSMASLIPASVSSQASSMASLSPASVSSNASLGAVGSSQASSIASLSPASVSSNASLGSLGSSQASSLLTRWSVTVSKTSSSFGF